MGIESIWSGGGVALFDVFLNVGQKGFLFLLWSMSLRHIYRWRFDHLWKIIDFLAYCWSCFTIWVRVLSVHSLLRLFIPWCFWYKVLNSRKLYLILRRRFHLTILNWIIRVEISAILNQPILPTGWHLFGADRHRRHRWLPAPNFRYPETLLRSFRMIFLLLLTFWCNHF